MPQRFCISCATRTQPGYVELRPLSLVHRLARCLPSTRMTSSNGCESLRESQVALISRTRGAAGIALTQCSLKVFIGESSLRIIDHRTARRYRGQSAHLVDRFLRRKDYSRPISSDKHELETRSVHLWKVSKTRETLYIRVVQRRGDKQRDFANVERLNINSKILSCLLITDLISL